MTRPRNSRSRGRVDSVAGSGAGVGGYVSELVAGYVEDGTCRERDDSRERDHGILEVCDLDFRAHLAVGGDILYPPPSMVEPGVADDPLAVDLCNYIERH